MSDVIADPLHMTHDLHILTTRSTADSEGTK
jgi:hypothetical protein